MKVRAASAPVPVVVVVVVAAALAAVAAPCHPLQLLGAAAGPPASCPTAAGTAHLSPTPIPAHCKSAVMLSGAVSSQSWVDSGHYGVGPSVRMVQDLSVSQTLNLDVLCALVEW